MKVGRYAKEYFVKYFSDTTKEYDLKNFLNKYWCHDNLGICYPLLKEVDVNIPITDQRSYNNDYSRYWVKPVLQISGRYYILCSQWFRQFKPILEDWITRQGDENNEKYIVKVVSKKQARVCKCCNTVNEKEFLLITYTHEGFEKHNTLVTYYCAECKQSYIANTTFKQYTKTKNLNELDVMFDTSESD